MWNAGVVPMSTVPVDRLASEVEKILDQYGNNLQQNLNDIVKEMSKKGAATLRSQSRGAVGGTGAYAKGWTSKAETGRVSAQGTIYNGKLPGLPHLLENGHANRNGGRTAGRVHIAPVAEQLIADFEKKVKAKL